MQSTHKTLTSLSQMVMLHVGKGAPTQHCPIKDVVLLVAVDSSSHRRFSLVQ